MANFTLAQARNMKREIWPFYLIRVLEEEKEKAQSF